MRDKRITGCFRVSQEDESTENQRLAITDFAKHKEFIIVAWFNHEAINGAIAPHERKDYKVMLKFCKDDNIKITIVD